MGPDTILVTNVLTPVKVGVLFNDNLVGTLREHGSTKDHIAEQSKDLKKACMVGLPDITGKIRTNDKIICDCGTGKIIVRPSAAVWEKYKKRAEIYNKIMAVLEEERDKDLQEEEGNKGLTVYPRGADYKIQIGANVSTKHEVEIAVEMGYNSINLVRTENFFRFNKDHSPRQEEPTEDEQIEEYSAIVTAANGRATTLRTLDPDGDKQIGYLEIDHDQLSNGNKGLALCLEPNTPLNFAFRRQLRSILQTKGKFKAMFPVVKSKDEVIQTLKMIAYEIIPELVTEGKFVNREINWGLMVEHTGILDALKDIQDNKEIKELLQVLAGEVPAKPLFFSIGDNDLLQSVANVNRKSDNASVLLDVLDPKLLKAEYEKIIPNIENAEELLSQCGGLASDWHGLLFLLWLRKMRIPSLATEFFDIGIRIIRSVKLADLDVMFATVMKMRKAASIRKFIDDFTKQKIKSGEWAGLELIKPLLFPEEVTNDNAN